MKEILNSNITVAMLHTKRKADTIIQKNGFMLSLTLKNKWIA